VKLSAQAVELEKSFRLFICRHWHCDSEGIFSKKEPHLSFVKREGVFLGTCGRLGVFSFELGASIIILLRFLFSAEYFIFPDLV
jgi:hypothetical protein